MSDTLSNGHSGAADRFSPSVVPTVLSWAPAYDADAPAELILARKHAEQELIQLLITRSGVSQAELAKRLGITPQALGQYVKAKRRATFHWVVRLAQVCGARISVDFPSLAQPLQVRAVKEDL
jgi:DNA-binding XRE family transcriptional regulator